MMDAVVDIRGSVLENLLDGVMVVERGGTVTVFNAAAGRILGLAPEEVAGKTFAEIFIVGEDFEELSELILGYGCGRARGGVAHADGERPASLQQRHAQGPSRALAQGAGAQRRGGDDHGAQRRDRLPGTADEVMQLLTRLNREERITILIITHDPVIARQCTRRTLIRDGVLVERDGVPPEDAAGP